MANSQQICWNPSAMLNDNAHSLWAPQHFRAVSSRLPVAAPKPICAVVTGRPVALWQRSVLHQPTVWLSRFPWIILLTHREHMSDRHGKTPDNEAVISKHVLRQRPAFGFCAAINNKRLHCLRPCLHSWTGSTTLTFTRLACLQERGAHPDDLMCSLCGLAVDTV